MSKLNPFLDYLKESPARYTYAFSRFEKFGLSHEEIREAKEIFINSLVDQQYEKGHKVERMWVSEKKTTVQLKPIEEKPHNEYLALKGWDYQEPLIVKGKVLLVYTADKHIGADVSDRALLGNLYDSKEFESRLLKTALKVIELDKVHHFSKVIIVDMGDAIDGMDGFTGSKAHKLPQNMNNRDVYQTFIDSHIRFFATLKEHLDCKDVEFRTIGESNHGGDMEWMCFKSLGYLLNEKYGMSVFIGNKFIEPFTLADHTFLLCHGKDFKNMKFPLPKNINDRTLLWIKAYIDHQGLSNKFVHFIKADTHVYNSELTEFIRYKNVLSMFGSSEWVQTNFMANTKGTSMDIIDLDSNDVLELNMFY